MTHPEIALEKRIAFYGTAIAVLYVALLAFAFANGVWLRDRTGAAKLMDFLPMWAAGHEAASGAPRLAYDPDAMRQLQLTVAGLRDSSAHFNFNYPPHFLLVLAPLGALPYLVAAFIWLAAQLCVFLGIVYLLLHRRAAVSIAAAMPLTLWGAYTVQDGFLTAALIGGSLYSIERRPAVAGILLGLLSYKPHLGILFPLVLLCAGRWRVFASAALTVVGLVAVSAAVFGLEAWQGFAAMLAQAATVYLGTGGPYGFSVIDSVYGLARWLGAGPAAAWTVHGAVAMAAAAMVCVLWRRAALSFDLKAAMLALGSLVVTPYLYAYDLVVLAVPAAFLVRDMAAAGVLRGELPVLIALYFGSALLIPFLVWVPWAPLAMAAMMALVLRRAYLDSGRYRPVLA